MSIPNQHPSRMIPILTMEEINLIRTAEDIPGIVASRPNRRFVEAPAAPENGDLIVQEATEAVPLIPLPCLAKSWPVVQA
jgi:hypothetical protein